MKLYITTTSPFARMAHIVVLEKKLEDRLELVPAETRRAGSPYYAINASGRVPFLVCDDGTMLEETQLICRYLDHLDGQPVLGHPSGEAGWESRRLEARARSLLDGLSVWVRELRRPASDRSATIIEHERMRGQRMCDLWESEIENPLMQGDFNMAQLTLICALQLELQNPGFKWRTGRSRLTEWADRLAVRHAIAQTVPPPDGA